MTASTARYTLVALFGMLLGAGPLAAQTPHRPAEVPVVPGSEPDTAGERAHAAAQAGGPAPRWYRMYKNESSMEILFDWYRVHLNAAPGEGPSDSVPDVPADGLTIPRYWLTFHDFKDVCADPATPPGTADSTRASGTPCKRWLLGKDKKNALGMSRIRYRRDDKWIDEALIRWYVREGAAAGEMLRIDLELRDIGLTNNWKYYAPRGEIIISAVAIAAPAP